MLAEIEQMDERRFRALTGMSKSAFIHTPQAEVMMEYFESFETKLAQTSLEERDIGYLKK